MPCFSGVKFGYDSILRRCCHKDHDTLVLEESDSGS